MAFCERCGKDTKLETYSYRVVCEEGTINIDAKYCSDCCDEIEEIHKQEKLEQDKWEDPDFGPLY